MSARSAESERPVLYEIINPSDPYTLRSDNEAAACLAVFLLGRGAYALDAVAPSGEVRQAMPIFLFNGFPDTWFVQHHLKGTTELLGAEPEAVAAALDSIVIGRVSDRRLYEAAIASIDDPAKAKAFEQTWREERRSSMADIGRAAGRLAEWVRQRAAHAREASAAAGASQAGLTLVELVIILAICGIVAAIAIPSFYRISHGDAASRAAAVVVERQPPLAESPGHHQPEARFVREALIETTAFGISVICDRKHGHLLYVARDSTSFSVAVVADSCDGAGK